MHADLGVACVAMVAGFIGYAGEVVAVVGDREIEDSDDDQLFYTLTYLDSEKRVGGAW